MNKNIPLIVQNIVYKKNIDDSFSILLLKRTEDRGGFWNVVNGTLEIDESILNCRSRELQEEAGITNVLNWSNELNRFSFTYKDYVIVVLVYSAEVDPNQNIIINEEHTEYRWVSFDEAINMMKFDDDKNGLIACRDFLINKIIC